MKQEDKNFKIVYMYNKVGSQLAQVKLCRNYLYNKYNIATIQTM